MMLSAYDPDCQATCPTCKKVVNAKQTGGNLAFPPRYVQIFHDECKTEWKTFIDESRTEILNERQTSN